VLVARVLYRKDNEGKRFTIVDAAMNDLMRPALYGAHHPMRPVRRTSREIEVTDVVGPICETGDVLGRSRRLAPAAEGDVLLIANAGAYGRVMSSRYNLREPAAEHLLPARG